jgi:hypothetical protein
MTDDSTISEQACETLGASYLVKWYHGTKPRYGWFIRGVLPDRRFYGEITVFLEYGGRQANVTGSLSEADYARFLAFVSQIKENATDDGSEPPCEGLLAEGHVTHPRIIFRYRRAGDETCDAGGQFLKIIDLLTPYLHQFYGALS